MREFWKREWPLWAFLAVAVALTAAAGSYNVRRMVASEEVLQTTRATHADLSALLADAVNAETGHRGYVLTGRDEHLEPFREADACVWDRLAALRERVSAHPEQGERLAAAERLIREKFDEMRRTIALRDTAGRDAAAAGVAEGQGKRTMDAVRVVVRDMLTAEEARLEQRAAAAGAQYRTAEFTNVLAAVLSVGVLAGVATLTGRERRRRERLAAKLAASKAETDTALGRLDAFLGHAPYGIAYFDPDLRFVRVNDTFARTHGVPIREHLGRSLTDVLPQFPPDLLADYRRVLDTGDGLAHRLVRGPEIVWEVTAFAVPDAGGRRGLGVIGLDVTDRQRQEEQLRDSEERFRAMADGIPQLAWMTRPDGYIFWYNQRWYDFTGTTLEEMEGWGWEKVHDPVELKRVLVSWPAALAAGESFEDTFPLRRHDGQMRWHLTRATPLKDADGRVLLWFGTNTDITEQKRNEQVIRDAASQLRQLTEGVPMLMWACRPSGECAYLSRQWVDYTGIPEADQLPYGWLDTVHPDDRSGTAEAWQAAVEGTAEYDIAFRLRRHDGEYRWFAVRGIPLRDHDGRIVRWYGSCTDIDDRKKKAVTLETMVTDRTAALQRANGELREQQIFLDAILDSVAEGIVACDADGRLKLFNAATRRMHGLPAEPVALDQWAEHYRLYEADGVTRMPADRVPLARAWAGEEVWDAEMMLRTPEGADRYVLCSGVQLRAADGSQFGAVVSMRDMTERREYERQLVVTAAALKVSNEELEASNEELEKFAYIASHDLQEPLRKIQAFGTRLAGKHRDALGDQGKEYIDRMLDSAGRMRKLIEDLLAFSRVATKTVPFDPVDLTAVVRDVLKDLELRVQQSGGRVEVGPLPFVRGDASQLRQVFQNLIGNALKFARAGVPPVVRVTAVPFHQLPPDADPTPPDGTGWRIAVADNGIGFEQGYAERIFELFQRLHARAQYEGTGLGLAIVRKIILRYGATIAARGTPNEGAAFLIDWPLRALPPT